MKPAIGVTYPPLPRILGISPHGVLAAAGIAVAAVLLNREVQRRAPQLHAATDSALVWGIVAGILGARLDYVISHTGDFHSIGTVVAVWDGGLALFGGLIAGSATAGVVLWRRGAHVPRLFDVAVPFIALAIAIGRVGDLMILDHLGKPTTSQFALAYRVQRGYHLAPGYGTTSATAPGTGQSCHQVGSYYAGCSYHLTAAYDLVGALTLAVVLYAASRRVAWRSGTATCLFGLWYGTQRLVVDQTRGIDERGLLGLSGTQLLAVGWIAAAIVSLSVILVRRRGLADSADSLPSATASLVRAPSRAVTL